MNTFIALKSDGSKAGFVVGKSNLGGLNADYEAKYCTCDENTTNTSEIADWDTAEEIQSLKALWLDYESAVSAATTIAQMKATTVQLRKFMKAFAGTVLD